MEGLAHYDKEVRPWGDFERFTLNDPSTVKILTVKPNETLSLQTHKNRDEFWKILKGKGIVRIGDTHHPAVEGYSFFAPRTVEHQMSASEEGLTFLEIAFGAFDEHDEVRIEDVYGRH